MLLAVGDSGEHGKYLENGVKAGCPAESLVVSTPFWPL